LETTNHATGNDVDYAAIVATSERLAWTVDEIFLGRRFDARKQIVPESWADTRHLPFLNAHEQLALNHIRAFSYAHLFGNFEEFVPLHLVEIAERDWYGDRAHLRALFRFGDEELKHQELMLRAEAVLESACGHAFGRYFDPQKHRVAEFTKALLSYLPLPRFLLLAALEWGTQRHYVQSVKDGAGCDALYADLLEYHWVEESQHIRTDVLEIRRLARDMSAEERTAAFDQVLSIAALVDEIFVGQVGQELATFERVTGRRLSEPEAGALNETLCRSMRAIFAEVGLTHPQFKRLALELSREGAAKLGIA